jgi:hypothetical protein
MESMLWPAGAIAVRASRRAAEPHWEIAHGPPRFEDLLE